MKALTVWRAVPPCCHAVLAQSMRAQHASNTTARANYHTHLPSFKRPTKQPSHLVGHRVGDADDENSRQRGAWDVPANYVKVAFNVSSLERPTETATMRQVSSPSRECRRPRGATMK